MSGCRRPAAAIAGFAVLGLAADLEPVRLEDRAGACPETRLILVDDQHGWHKHIVAQESGRGSTASHTISSRDSPPEGLSLRHGPSGRGRCEKSPAHGL